ncbi:MAG: hypothetical protein SOX32_11585, partial [Candidatus Choladocola sp.]|nr:hypothetical protein [Candidatus Choladocola sp.]
SGRPASGQRPGVGGKQIEERPEESFRMNFWGYGEGFYFAPKYSYAAGNSPVEELKDMIRAFHAEGIEVLPEFSFGDHTDLGLISRCLDYWASEYHVDGFCVIARNEIASELARMPLFRKRKLICSWFPESIIKENEKAPKTLLAESNDGFLYDCRRLLKGDENALAPFAAALRKNPEGCAGLNYITNHDGFTLMDLVSYDRKHNLENGEQERDGSDYNVSWNCGVEGPSKKREIQQLRMRQRKNAYAMMLFSQRTPMLLAGDEFGNSQNGNNNPYCHDSELSWVDWSRYKSGGELLDFVKKGIAYRKAHRVLHQQRELKCSDVLSTGFPDLSFHGDQAWFGDFDRTNRHLGCMYSGAYAQEEGFIYIAYNFHWSEQDFALPLLPRKQSWYKVMDTSQKDSFAQEVQQECLGDARSFSVPARTIVILEGREHETESVKNDNTSENKRPSEDHH